MKHFWLLLLLFTGTVAANDWLRAPDAESSSFVGSTELSGNAYSEVSASTLLRAVATLADQPFVLLNQASVSDFSSGHFTCVFPQQAYLVRAVYQNEATGGFSIRIKDGALLVSHGSLGQPSEKQKTALVVCLRSAPTDLFVSASSAL
jgi:hypothetical protein